MCSTAQAPREGRLLAYPESGLLWVEQACDTAIGRCTSRLLIGSASWPVAAAVAYKVLWIAVSATSAPQRRQHPSWCPPTLVSASLSALVAISRSHLLVWWWLAHGEVEGQLVRAAIGQVHPLAAVWAHQVGRPRTAAKGLDDLLLLGRHLFTLPQLCRSPHAAPTGPRRSPRPRGAPCRSAYPRGEVLGVLHRILVLQRPELLVALDQPAHLARQIVQLPTSGRWPCSSRGASWVRSPTSSSHGRPGRRTSIDSEPGVWPGVGSNTRLPSPNRGWPAVNGTRPGSSVGASSMRRQCSPGSWTWERSSPRGSQRLL